MFSPLPLTSPLAVMLPILSIVYIEAPTDFMIVKGFVVVFGVAIVKA